MKPLIDAAVQALEAVVPRVFAEYADGEAELPCIVYRVVGSKTVGRREDITFQVDVRGSSGNPALLDELADQVNEALDGRVTTGAGFWSRWRRVSRSMPEADHPSVRVRRLRLLAQTYYIEEE